MNADPLRRVDPQRAVENVVPQRAVAVAAGAVGEGFRSKDNVWRIGARHDEGRRMRSRTKSRNCAIAGARPIDFSEVLVDGRLGATMKSDVLEGP